jgi:ribosomal protein S20
VKSAIRQAREATAGQTDQPVAEALATAHSAIDKAAKRHVLHPRAAARKKSRLAKAARGAAGA